MMDIAREIVSKIDCARLDKFLAGQEGIPTRSIAQKLIADNLVTINGKISTKKQGVAVGDIVSYTIPAPIPTTAIPEDIPLHIIYEDGHILVVDKPQGLVVHPGAGNWTGTLVNALLHHAQGDLSGIGGVLRPGIVHRLDKNTSGIMVVAKNDMAHQSLSAQLADRSALREYTAICHGSPDFDHTKIDKPIARHPTDRTKMFVPQDAYFGARPDARPATTYVDVLERYPKHSLVKARLETGRTHQIRVHMAAIGHPILGDDVYSNRPLAKNWTGQLLHATTLAFIHPATGQAVSFTAPYPAYFKNTLEEIRKS